jgi:hypothetical protein
VPTNGPLNSDAMANGRKGDQQVSFLYGFGSGNRIDISRIIYSYNNDLNNRGTKVHL